MKTSLLLPACTLLGITALAADEPPKLETSNPAAKVTGRATVTIDINGRKETRSFDLDKATLIKIDDQPAAGALVSTRPTPAAVLRTLLGVVTDEPSEDVRSQISIPEGTGLFVRSVLAESPAARAGLEKGDLLLRLDEQILINPDQLRKLIGTKKDGDSVRLAYLRKGHEAAAEVRLGSHLEEPPGGTFVLGKVLPAEVAGELHSALKPLVVESTIALDKAGNLGWSDLSNKARAALNEKFGYFFSRDGQPNLEEATQELEKALRSVGTKEEAIAQIKKSLDDAAEPLRQWARDMGGRKFDTQLLLQSAAEDIRRSVEQVWRARVEAALRSIPDEPGKGNKAGPAAPAPEKTP